MYANIVIGQLGYPGELRVTLSTANTSSSLHHEK